MWVLISSKGSAYTLLTGRDHVVSRRDGDLVLADDQSISRKHAVFSVLYDSKSMGDPRKLPEVTLTDSSSKYGTFINDGIEKSVKMANGSSQVLKNGDHIRFGLQWNQWSLEHRPLVVTTSTLSPAEKRNLKQHILKLGGHLVSNWQDDVTHVTMKSLTLTVKVVCALARGRPIVTPQYWEQYVTALSTNVPVPSSKDYIPPLAETTLNMNQVSFDINENRKNLFLGKKFVFSSEHQFKNYSCMITAADGEAVMMSSALSLESLISPDIIMMQYSLPRYSQDSQIPSSFENVSKFLKSKKRRLIPESEIGLAILHCSLEKNCNPQFRVASTLLSNDSRDIDTRTHNVTLALDTQHETESESMKHSKPHDVIIIPESGTVRKELTSAISEQSTLDNTMIIPESGTSQKPSPSNLSISPIKKEDDDVICIKIEKSGSSNGAKRERLSTTDEVDATPTPLKRRKVVGEEGFLTKRSSSFHRPPMKVDVKIESDDEEDMFKFPTDASTRRKDESDEEQDMFAFADQPNVEQPVGHVSTSFIESPRKKKEEKKQLSPSPESFEYPKKRKAIDKEIEPISKKPALEKKSVDMDVHQDISLNGFLDTKHLKENQSLDDSVTNVAEGMKNVTVVEVKPLLSQKIHCSPKINIAKGKNFKRFMKHWTVHSSHPIRTQNLVPYQIDKKGLNDWLNESHNATVKVQDEDEDDNDDDWAFVQPSQASLNVTSKRRR